MSHNNELQCCRVCGAYSEGFFPWGESGLTPTHDICFCCGIEFGIEDSGSLEEIKAYRERWIDMGGEWCLLSAKPADWNLEEQLANIPDRFR
jgi:hypothetical protein